MIIYEGHIEHENLFPNRRSHAPRVASASGSVVDRPAATAASDNAANKPLALEGVPVVMLQTCASLQKKLFRDIFAAGGVAMLGTASPVHSISGSSFVKAMCDGALYHNETIGEAFRDARNYFFCLRDLKLNRGHKQLAQSQRVALSFRLWGDPELELLPQRHGQPLLAPVSAHWLDRDRIGIHVPAEQLPVASNDKYAARVSPGSETAGLVDSVANDSLRRVTPLYFFKLPVPEDFAASDRAGVVRVADKVRAVYRCGPPGHFFYLLYYPYHERPGETVILEIGTQPGRSPR